MGKGEVAVLPIRAADIAEVAHFLHQHLNSDVSAKTWARSIDPSWQVDAPDHGFYLRDGDAIVGAYLAFYSDRRHGDQTLRVCNLAAWCVLDDYRSHGLRLARALLRRKGLHFTDLSPSGNVIEVNRRLGFRQLDTTTAASPCLPVPRLDRRLQITSDPRALRKVLTGPDRAVFDDHALAGAAHHVLISKNGDHCHVVWRRDRRKRVRGFGSVLHASNPALLLAHWSAFASHLGLRHGVLVALVERRVLGALPPRSRLLPNPRPKMYRSDVLTDDDIDYLYSELTSVPW